MEEEILISRVSDYVQELLENELPGHMYFHNFEHTLLVVEGVKIIGVHSAVSEHEMLVLTLAAYLHDIGYTRQYIGHEAISAEMAGTFLNTNGLSSLDVEQVKNCILATKYPQLPHNNLEKIICDADFYHFALPAYTDFAVRLKREWEENINLAYSHREWDAINIKMLIGHQYFTDYGKQFLQKKKDRNIEKLIQRFT
ncbi:MULTISPECIES: HD domain-containing protein [unclassified Pedobacter]|uniref:HD domain-containing protein n=1 Tax=unclassified Pedobacter TaxID=2628915 RepID=UPI00141DBA0C|nr:HD domain-containing protein [Pedobacter sp. SG918]NII82227.1 putative metal-dependent HD superfamily phosphohydrolase [Pedobacter sp. SG908]NMN36251.1 putative metal-dependent HD superfamily phosphohydrolase [Pedobacter sp. SG918]